jgi:hypothetical protein
MELTGRYDKYSANIAETLPLEARIQYAHLIIHAIDGTVDVDKRKQAIKAVFIGLWLRDARKRNTFLEDTDKIRAESLEYTEQREYERRERIREEKESECETIHASSRSR